MNYYLYKGLSVLCFIEVCTLHINQSKGIKTSIKFYFYVIFSLTRTLITI